MPKRVFAMVMLGGIWFASSAWALPQSAACHPRARAHRLHLTGGPPCGLAHDPWQDCGEDPWQLSYESRSGGSFSDPWQDSADPWQPFAAALTVTIRIEESVDPWQPVVLRLRKRPFVPPVVDDDPWQPGAADPWQDSADPWQVP